MKRITVMAGIALIVLNSTGMADELDDLKLVDESDKSALFQKGPIVGCSDHAKKKELSCAKKADEAILNKLPTSQQIETKDLDDKSDNNEVKTQLTSILEELSQLKKEQKTNRETIKELKSLIAILSDKKSKNVEKKSSIQEGIKKIALKQAKPKTATRIRQAIKEIEKNENHVIIEVQNNESLSTYAQAYYNDNKQYYKIYKANKDKIGKDLQIIIGDRLTIPLP
ncbi:hypothetical protein KKC13_12815 [bacterium]|nr:hypothetical protein [bacterium]MBU1956825.1 hypothetical protein [bacterium]